MELKTLEDNYLHQKLTSLTGLKGTEEIQNDQIDKYFNEFMDWLEFNNVLKVINNYKKINMTLSYVEKSDYLVWLFHFGDIFENIESKLLENNKLSITPHDQIIGFLKRNGKDSLVLSYTVALTHQIKEPVFFSDKDLNNLIPLLANIPNNQNSNEDEHSDIGDKLYDALYSLSNYGVERVARDCI